MKSWMKAVVWLLIIYAIVMHVCIVRSNNNGGDRVVDFYTPGPTCDTYYYRAKDLRVCPMGQEFDYRRQSCVTDGDDHFGCRATVARWDNETNLRNRVKAMKKQQLLK
ncbi:hypothetical protein [Alphabaculovirus altersperidaniae]|uniref:Chitin-binding type-2 domain-containing protein n=1 Tax=Spodoptera eridania nucleopolyhedrovirus TaxID=2315721 RepID=A0ABX6TQ22_9ABAC|nr:hypothetical protein QKS47_gp103 [Spodoptera eridania nucleopolyhedrovirus]QNV47823.1 hypothetical protein [Spodoptera eridania nucleopolyhedrovirus]